MGSQPAPISGILASAAAFSDSSGQLPRAVLLSLGLAVLACSRSTPPPTKTSVEPPPAATSGSDTPANSGSGAATNQALAIGSPAPEFSVVAHNGQKVSLSGQRGKVVILYFYPKDGTPGCTVEAEKFRDEHASFTAKNAIVLGVSSDDNASHEKFAEELGLPFLLLPDPEGAIRNAYGVGSFLGIASRETIVIDRAGKVAQIYRKVDPNTHADEILRAIEKL